MSNVTTSEAIFRNNLTEYHREINFFILKFCIAGGIIGIAFFTLLKVINVLDRITWQHIIRFALITVVDLLIPSIAYIIFSKRNSKTFISIFKYTMVTCSIINYYALVTSIPYKEMWSVVFFVIFLSAFFLEIRVVLFSISVSLVFSIIGFYTTDTFPPQESGELIIRILSFNFGALAAIITAFLSRKLLIRSSTNEHKAVQSLKELEILVNKASEVSTLLSASSEQISSLAGQQNSASETMATSSTEVASGAEQTLKSIKEGSFLINELFNSIKSSQQKIYKLSETSRELKKVAGEGIESINSATEKISSIKNSVIITSQTTKELDSKAKEIDNIVESIKQIADQTNLLSLNASIEASRAGAHGRGFAVVADEIRKLAEQSHSSLKSINETLGEIITQSKKLDHMMNDSVVMVDEGVNIVNMSKEYYQKIISNLSGTIDSLTEVYHFSNNQLTESESVNEFMSEVNKIAEKTSKNVEWIASSTQEGFAASEELLKAAQQIEQMAREMSGILEK